MSVKTAASIFFGILIIASVKTFGQDVELDWYRHFFSEQKKGTVEVALQEANNRLATARLEKNYLGMTQALKESGLIQLTKLHDYDSAMIYFIQCLALEDSLVLRKEEVFTYLGIAHVFVEVGNFKRAQQALMQADSLSAQTSALATHAFVLNALGKVNASMGLLHDALTCYEKVLAYDGDKMDDASITAEALFNLGHLYTLQNKYDSALQYHKRALKIRRLIRDKNAESISLNDIGELYALKKNDERALANHVEALKIRLVLKDKQAMAHSYNNIGEIYVIQKNYERAIANLTLALKAAMEGQVQSEMRRSNEYLSQCYKALGDYKTALEFESQMVLNIDYIQNERNERQLLESQNRYLIGKKESKINSLEADRREKENELLAQKKIRNALSVSVGLALVIVVMVLYFYLQKRKTNTLLQAFNEQVQQQNVQLQQLNDTKDKFFSIISHDLKGPLNSLTSFSGLLINHIENLSQDEIQMLAKDLDKSVKNLFTLLENLLEWSRSQTGNIEFKPEPFDIALVLEENKELLKAQAQNKKINLINEDKTPVPVRAHKNSVTTVVRNLISNAIKFTPEEGMILISAKRLGNEVQVSIADNGVGMSAERIQKLFRIDTKHSTKGTADEKGTGLGLILCKDFVEKNGGRLWVESEVDKGSVFYFTLPVE